MTGTPYPLGRSVEHDPRSRSYRVKSAPTVRATVRWTRVTPILDQGNTGSCTGNAGTGVLGSSPYAATLPAGLAATFDENYALALYGAATAVDNIPGAYPPDDTGSTGLAVAKVLKTRGLVSGYQHAFGIDDAFAAIQSGPLMIGTDWLEKMFYPAPDGLVDVSGVVAGGHEYECVGYDATTDRWEFVNSWGTGWGKAGHFFMTTSDFDRLLKNQGDVILLTPVTQPAPTPNPTDAKAAAKAMLDAWAAKRHTGDTARAAAAWKTYTA